MTPERWRRIKEVFQSAAERPPQEREQYLAAETSGDSELRREVGGVSEKMLAQTLQTLERDGFVHRDAKPVIPPRVDYSLTGLGREAAEQVWALARWTERRLDTVQAAREADDARKQEAAQSG